jgi:hypothetical protein
MPKNLKTSLQIDFGKERGMSLGMDMTAPMTAPNTPTGNELTFMSPVKSQTDNILMSDDAEPLS